MHHNMLDPNDPLVNQGLARITECACLRCLAVPCHPAASMLTVLHMLKVQVLRRRLLCQQHKVAGANSGVSKSMDAVARARLVRPHATEVSSICKSQKA
jgi:hypothetical protein